MVEGIIEQSAVHAECINWVHLKQLLSWKRSYAVVAVLNSTSGHYLVFQLPRSACKKKGFSWKLRTGKDERGNLTLLHAVKGNLIAQFF